MPHGVYTGTGKNAGKGPGKSKGKGRGSKPGSTAGRSFEHSKVVGFEDQVPTVRKRSHSRMVARGKV